MYSYIKGRITEIKGSHIVLENNGIGYHLRTPNPFNFALGEETIVFIYQHVREDTNDLFGFKSKDEKDLFLRLLSVKGLGPKGGLAILAADSVRNTVAAIEESNVAYFQKFPGIGQKSSQQIILDLKGKINFELDNLPNDKFSDAQAALKALGFSGVEIKSSLKHITNKNASTEEIVKEALKKMTKSS
jgi:Holliday junction DNA helicase RuvA